MKKNLVYDVGLHKGEDTEFYLRKGFRVVGIEANPTLVVAAKIRFQDEIAKGQLKLIDGAVGPASAGSNIVFYANSDMPVWSTIRANWAARNERLGSPSERTEVRRVDMAEVYRSLGVPFYLKVDVEGVDRIVVEELKAFDDRPQYLSLESDKRDFDQLKAELDLLTSIGYKKFKVVQQQTIPGTKIRARTVDGQEFEHVFGAHSSGPFGDDLPGPWLNHDETVDVYRSVFRRYKYFGDYSLVRRMPGKLRKLVDGLYCASTGYIGPLPGWFDTHASL